MRTNEDRVAKRPYPYTTEGDRDDINDRPVFSVTGDMGGMHTNHQESSQMMSFCYTYTYMRFMI